MHPNHQFLLEFIRGVHGGQCDFRALDYGCGRGEVVAAGREAGLDVWGADSFAFGGMADAVERLGLPPGVIRSMDGPTLPFPDAHFDVLVSNQVLEHVPNLHETLAEMRRVLRPGGQVLSIFPSLDVIRENHCGIPMIHWFPKGSRTRFYYGLGMAYLGFGHRRPEEDRAVWLDHFLQRMDHRVFYRRREEILAAFDSHFHSTVLREDLYIRFRLQKTPHLRPLIPLARHPVTTPLAKEAFRRLGSLVLVSRVGRGSPL